MIDHYHTDENGEEHCLAPIPGCECMHCHYERDLAARGKTGENRIEPQDSDDVFAYERAKERRKEQRRGDRWLESYGYL